MGVFLAGLAFIGLGCCIVWSHYRKKRLCTAQVIGFVSDIIHSVKKSKGRKRNQYKPVYTYSVFGVKHVRKLNVTYSSPSKFPLGMQVVIFYNPSDPKQFYVAEHGLPLFVPLAFIVVGVGVCMLAP